MKWMSSIVGCVWLLACGGEAPDNTPPPVQPSYVPTTAMTPSPMTAEPTQEPTLREVVAQATAEATNSTDDEVAAVINPIVNSATQATDEDVANAMPRSAEAGEPDVAASCNTMGFTKECMETSRTGLGQGTRSTEGGCVNGIWSTERPCPVAGRVGTCRISNDQQTVHYYFPTDRDADPEARARSVCEMYRGEFFPAPALTFPLNSDS
jgi:hypothetical protein